MNETNPQYAAEPPPAQPPVPPHASQHPQVPQQQPQVPQQAYMPPQPEAHTQAPPPQAPPSQAPAEPVNPIEELLEPTGPRVIDTSSDKQDGLDKCPRCGSTEISLRPQSGLLICHFCRHEWAETTIDDHFGFDSPIDELEGLHLGSGASNIQESTSDVVTLKCGGCGAEVVVNTAEAASSRCHWCRHNLSVNQQLPNGAIPDGILPFAITREDAIARIDEFVKKRKFFAHPHFVREFKPTEVLGVYLPYLLVDTNIAMQLQGEGEIQTRSYTVKEGDKDVRVYDADVYQLSRSFDLTIDDLTIESASGRTVDISRNTNNVIDAVQPFDLKKTVKYNAHYMRGFTSEKRDVDVPALMHRAYDQALSVGRARAGDTIGQYDRGVRWSQEHLTMKGSRWVAVYVPVWLYSYYQPDKQLVHYVAVNGRTGNTMGSVPVRYGRLVGLSVLIGIVGTVVGGILDFFMLF